MKIDGNKARHPSGYECSSRMQLLPSILAGAGVLSVLVDVCERPGQSKTGYSNTNKARFNAIEKLATAGLVTQQRDPAAQGRSKVYPTEEGKSIYIGLWYAANNGALLPRMMERGIPLPPALWSLDSVYSLSEADEEGYYFLVDTTVGDADHDYTIYDTFIDPDGDMWFSIDGAKGRFCLDVEKQLDLDSGHARECFRKIVEKSKKEQAEISARTYDDLLSCTEPPEE